MPVAEISHEVLSESRINLTFTCRHGTARMEITTGDGEGEESHARHIMTGTAMMATAHRRSLVDPEDQDCVMGMPTSDEESAASMINGRPQPEKSDLIMRLQNDLLIVMDHDASVGLHRTTIVCRHETTSEMFFTLEKPPEQLSEMMQMATHILQVYLKIQEHVQLHGSKYSCGCFIMPSLDDFGEMMIREVLERDE